MKNSEEWLIIRYGYAGSNKIKHILLDVDDYSKAIRYCDNKTVLAALTNGPATCKHCLRKLKNHEGGIEDEIPF